MTVVNHLRPPATIAQRLGRTVLRLFGWQIVLDAPLPARCVVIGAHHTSALDFYLVLGFMLATGIRVRWVAKDSLFRGPIGWILRRLGGLPVNRRVRTNFVEKVVALFAAEDELRLAISPEGTRGHTPHWRTGFYYMALGARVPIVLGYADYARRIVGTGPILQPTGDLEGDMALIRAFYTGIVSRHPEKQGVVVVRDRQTPVETDA